MPVVEALVREGVAVSVDTMKPEVMRAAIDAGCAVVNDVNALPRDGRDRGRGASGDVGVVVMHMQGTPATMQQEPRYDDVVAEVGAFLRERAAALEAAGVARERIVLDPGFGFGKTLEHNKQLFRALPQARARSAIRCWRACRARRCIGDITGRPRGRARRRQRCRGPARGAEWRESRARA